MLSRGRASAGALGSSNAGIDLAGTVGIDEIAGREIARPYGLGIDQAERCRLDRVVRDVPPDVDLQVAVA